MADRDQHCRDCIAELGEPFGAVHDWLDEFFPKVGPYHRPIRHHDEGVEEVRKKWGDRAARAAEIHIHRDYGFIPTKEDADLSTLWTPGKEWSD